MPQLGDDVARSAFAVPLLHPGQGSPGDHDCDENDQLPPLGRDVRTGEDRCDDVGEHDGLDHHQRRDDATDAGRQSDVATGRSHLAQQARVKRSHLALTAGARAGTGRLARGCGRC